jgi:hypothetical protein
MEFKMVPITSEQLRFYTVMAEHYKERFKANQGVYFLRNTYNSFKKIIDTKMIPHAVQPDE